MFGKSSIFECEIKEAQLQSDTTIKITLEYITKDKKTGNASLVLDLQGRTQLERDMGLSKGMLSPATMRPTALTSYLKQRVVQIKFK